MSARTPAGRFSTSSRTPRGPAGPPLAPTEAPTGADREPSATFIAEPDGRGARVRLAFVESILDNLSAWALMAAAIGFLYLVWVTLEVLDHYVGPVPKVTP